uniref:Uncharacterized protein n=1 Tax=Onchocerca volvulus TaxID=6282 RepID=A0A8R1TU90_ONCVO
MTGVSFATIFRMQWLMVPLFSLFADFLCGRRLLQEKLAILLAVETSLKHNQVLSDAYLFPMQNHSSSKR